MGTTPEKERAVETAMGQIERQFGKGSIMKLGSSPLVDVPVIPTGSLALDKALGVGGLPRGRVIEIYGPESSGKTTLALHAVAEAQKKGGIVAGALGEPVPAIVHGGEMILTQEQQRGIIDYELMSAAVADALEDVLPGKERPMILQIDGANFARTMFPALQREEKRLGLVTP